MSDTPATAILLKKILNKNPVKVENVGVDGWLHPINPIDDLVLQSQLQEVMLKLETSIREENVRLVAFNRACIIATVQASLHTGEDPKSPLVFPTFEDAYLTLQDQPQVATDIFQMHKEAFEITEIEKKS